MKVVVFNVGAALSAYVETDNKKIVIDLGKSSDFSPVNDFLIPLFEKRGEKKNYSDKYYLSQVFISHPHQDHISV
jgi:mRNA degradation ribonuclease J1/J2